MTFDPDRVAEFLLLFDERSTQIRDFAGCRHLELLQDNRHPNVMTTLSIWESDDALAAYRNSDLFVDTWALTKTMFADRPTAASHTTIRRLTPDGNP